MSAPSGFLNSQEIYYRIHGDPTDSPPIVLLHGLLGFSANWGKIWPYFSTKRQVLVLDQRGHGRSAKPTQGYTPDDYAGDLLGLLDELGWQKIHLLGHSMGGRVAIHFAHQHPNRLQSLTLEDSGAEARPDRINWIKGILGKVPTPFPDREAAKKFFDESYKSEPMLGGFLNANLVANEQGTLDWRFYKAGMVETIETGRATDATKLFCALTTPTLLIRGEKSTEFARDEADRMIQCRKDVWLSTIPGAGHWVHADKPMEFCMAVERFLSKWDA